MLEKDGTRVENDGVLLYVQHEVLLLLITYEKWFAASEQAAPVSLISNSPETENEVIMFSSVSDEPSVENTNLNE